MERVDILIQRLQEQLQQQAGSDKLLITAQMLVAELHHKQIINSSSKVAVTMPAAHHIPIKTPVEEAKQQVEVHDTIELPQPVEAESFIAEEEIVAKEEPKAFEASPFFFDTVASIPTLAHQEPKEVFALNDTLVAQENTYNARFRENKKEVASLMEQTPIKDLKKAININDRYLFINELFRGDEAMYERSLKTIQGFTILPEAVYWIQRELKLKLGWSEESQAVQMFDQLVNRRFS